MMMNTMNDDLVEQATIAALNALDGDTPETWAALPERVRDDWRTAVRAALVAAGVTTEREREARLAAYRCAIITGHLMAGACPTPDEVEEQAHKMLAAERPAGAAGGAGK